MTYIMADLHGCYSQFCEMLRKINFSDKDDTLYLLGDLVDRGPEPIKVLLEVMERPSIVALMGNHDFNTLQTMELLASSNVPETKAEELLDDWLAFGGGSTIEQLVDLPLSKNKRILKFLRGLPYYQEIWIGEDHYILTHAGIRDFVKGKLLASYHPRQFISGRLRYDQRYFEDPNTFLVSGHTPTPLIREDQQPLVYQGHGHIALDCGCVFGGKLACFCCESKEVIYVDGYHKL